MQFYIIYLCIVKTKKQNIMKKRIYKTYSVYDVAHSYYLHISATSKAHVKEYLKVTGLNLYCSDDIQVLHLGAESSPIEINYPQWFGLAGTNIDF